MKRQLSQVLIVSGEKCDHSIIERLKIVSCSISVNFVNIDGASNVDISSLVRLSGKHHSTCDLQGGDYFGGATTKLVDRKDFSQLMVQGLDLLHRDSREFIAERESSNFSDLSLNDCRNYYHISIDVISRILIENNIKSVVFLNLPHLFHETVLYDVAKASGIETIIVTQSIFPNRYYSLKSMNDCGCLPQISSEDEFKPISIDPNESQDWHHIKNIYREPDEYNRYQFRGILNLVFFLLKTNPLKFLNPIYMFRITRRMERIPSKIPKWRDPFARFFHVEKLAYFESLMEFEYKQIDLLKNFVFFPLQMQSEMTISSLGGRYSDQILAIECLVKIIPNDCVVYVKEEPKQTGKMRSPMFFHRLRRINNVEIVPSYTNTHDLIDKAEFVATIAGTVGWEAIRKGKAVLVFGWPWYRSLPGVIEFHEKLNFEDICNSKFHHSDLEKFSGWLASRAHIGVIDPKTARYVDNFNEENNADNVARTILDLVESRLPTTFPTVVTVRLIQLRNLLIRTF